MAAIGLALAGPASGQLTLSEPLVILLPNGTTAYDPALAGANFHVDTGAIGAILVPNGPFEPIIGGATTIRIEVDTSGALVGGNPSGRALQVAGTLASVPGCDGSVPLLEGDVTSFAATERGSTDLFDFTFTATGGCLLGQYGNGIGVAITSENSTFAGNFSTKFSGGAKGNLGQLPGPCASIALDARCLVQQPVSTGPWNCSDAKPLNELSMIWNGSQTIDVKAWKGSVGSTLLATVDNVAPGDDVVVDGYAGSPNDVIWELFAAGTGNKLGESTFHLSCSDANMNGPEDCGQAQGDGKDKSGFINDWLLDGLAGNGLSFTCTPPQPPTFNEAQDNCMFAAQLGVGCKAPGFEGKPTSLTFQFSGGTCAASNNPQSDKAKCAGSVNPADPVQVQAGKTGLSSLYPVSPTTVQPGGTFTITGPFDADSSVKLSNAGGTQTLGIHTSCSQPLVTGDVFGAITLIGITNDKGVSASSGANVDYFCQVTNPGPVPLKDVVITEDMVTPAGLPKVCVGALVPGTLAVGQSQVVGPQTRFITETTTDIFAVEGKGNTNTCGDTVMAMDQVVVQVKKPKPVCVEGTATVEADFNGTAIPSGRTIWFNSIVKTRKLPGSGAKVTANCSLKFNGSELELPPALITYDPSATQATTTYNDADQRWETTLPVKDVNAFLTGIGYPSPGLPGGIKDVAWTCEMTSDVPGLEAEWKWAAAVYTDFSPNPNAIGVKPVDGDKLSIYDNSDHAGTPENFKNKVVGGARGGGGSNYTGSYSGTAKVKPCPDGSAPPPVTPFDCDSHIDTVRFVWDGSQTVDVQAFRDKDGNTLQQSLTNIAPNQVATVGGYTGSPNDVIWKIYAAGTNSLIGTSKFHLSCSDSAMDGAEDCGSPQGNGKSNEAGFLNTWLLKGLTTEKGSTLSCP